MRGGGAVTLGGLLIVWAALAAACGQARGEEPAVGAFALPCAPASCESLGANCGEVQDGCGGTLSCGTCESGTSCGGGGTPNLCGSSACEPKTCSDLVVNCGEVSDGCGGTLRCGTCPVGEACGAGALPNVCAPADCEPLTCEGAAECGRVSNSCGESLSCGSCEAGAYCDPEGRCQTATSLDCADVALGAALPVTHEVLLSQVSRDTRSEAPCGAEGLDVLFEWIAPDEGAFVVDAAGSDFPASLTLRSGTCEGPVLACDDALQQNGPAKLIFEALGGERFFLQVDGAPSRDSKVVLHIVSLVAVEKGEACLDGADNDGDGRVDCADTDCEAESFCEEAP